jgi:hypothetical protein
MSLSEIPITASPPSEFKTGNFVYPHGQAER